MNDNNTLHAIWDSIEALEKRSDDDFKKITLYMEVLETLVKRNEERTNKEIDGLTKLADAMTQNIGHITTTLDHLVERVAVAEQRVKALEDRPPPVSGNL